METVWVIAMDHVCWHVVVVMDLVVVVLLGAMVFVHQVVACYVAGDCGEVHNIS